MLQKHNFDYGQVGETQPFWGIRIGIRDDRLSNDPSYTLSHSELKTSAFAPKCELCGFQTKNKVKFEVSFGPADDRLLRICMVFKRSSNDAFCLESDHACQDPACQGLSARFRRCVFLRSQWRHSD